MAFQKKHLIIVAMVCVIGVAAFISWQFQQDETNQLVSDIQDASKNLGQSQLVNADGSINADAAKDAANELLSKTDKDDYFSEARLNRTKARDASLELLREIISDTETSEDARTQATQEMGLIATSIEKEANIESLAKAKGFTDCVAVISTSNVNVVVESQGLQPNEAAQLNEIVMNETGVTADNIKIIEIK